MRIMQINSPVVCGPEYVGKWFCSDSIPGDDGDPVIRYLQHDGRWGKTSDYFDSEAEIHNLLALGHQPDFQMNPREREDRRTIREMAEESFRRDWEWEDDLDDRPYQDL